MDDLQIHPSVVQTPTVADPGNPVLHSESLCFQARTSRDPELANPNYNSWKSRTLDFSQNGLIGIFVFNIPRPSTLD